jgi:hypothetical protein
MDRLLPPPGSSAKTTLQAPKKQPMTTTLLASIGIDIGKESSTSSVLARTARLPFAANQAIVAC